jgi:Ni,Fe-hydrogenase I large subunit
MKGTINVSPVTRIEGHLGVKVETEGGRVTSAHVVGEMFRGFEQILRGRDPLDAQQITQRICGVCPVEHGIASILAQDAAYGIVPTDNGRIVRNLIQAAISSRRISRTSTCSRDWTSSTSRRSRPTPAAIRLSWDCATGRNPSWRPRP